MTDLTDTLVIGGGVAGLVTARELNRAGYSTRLLEARDRLGGRCQTTSFAGHPAEAGAQWISWLHPHLWAETRRYGLALEPSRAVVDHRWKDHGVERVATGREFERVISPLVDQFCHDAASAVRWPLGPHDVADLATADRTTIAERLSEIEVPEGWLPMMQAVLAGTTLAPNDEASLVHVLRWYAGAGYRMWGQTGRLVLRDGTRALIDALEADVADIRLSTPVSRIERSETGFTVTSGEELHHARSVVLAVPLNVLAHIDLTLDMVEGVEEVLAAGQPSRGLKLYARVAGRLPDSFWRASDDQPLHALRTDRHLSDSTVVIGLGPASDRLDGNDATAVQQAIRHWLPDAVVLESWSHDWVADPWSRGAWGATRVGQLRVPPAVLRNPSPRLHLAGADLADGWTSFIDGAIETGLSASAAVRTDLSEASSHITETVGSTHVR